MPVQGFSSLLLEALLGMGTKSAILDCWIAGAIEPGKLKCRRV